MQFISDVAADLFQAKTPDAKVPPVAEDLGVEELVQRCDAIVGRLQGAGASAGPQRPGTPGAGRVTLSLGLQVSARAGRVLVRDTVPGGPAACSKKLGRGDAIIKIDGVPASPDNFDRLAAGTGQPGSIATLTILKAETIADLHGTAMPALAADERSLLEVKLKRMCRSEMSDNVSHKSLGACVAWGVAGGGGLSARCISSCSTSFPAHRSLCSHGRRRCSSYWRMLSKRWPPPPPLRRADSAIRGGADLRTRRGLACCARL